MGKPAQHLLLTLIHEAKTSILGHTLWLKQQDKQNNNVGHRNGVAVDDNKDLDNTAKHKISTWIVAQMATRNKVPKNIHITHMDASTGGQAIVFQSSFKYVNVVEQKADCAGELYQSILKSTPGKMPLNFSTFPAITVTICAI